jgi:hypothetical protein
MLRYQFVRSRIRFEIGPGMAGLVRFCVVWFGSRVFARARGAKLPSGMLTVHAWWEVEVAFHSHRVGAPWKKGVSGQEGAARHSWVRSAAQRACFVLCYSRFVIQKHTKRFS